MVWGHHVASCHHCGKQWMVGDCIPSMCDECEEKGHDRLKTNMKCPKCLEKYSPEYKKILEDLEK